MKKVENLRELQKIDIFIYRDLKKFCDENKIRVYLHGGSLIGAIRHKGFIPWDDDIDVCMSRPDYERLKRLSNGKISRDCTLIDPEDAQEFNGYIPVVVYNASKMESAQFRIKEDMKIGISIFIYDGIIGNKFLQIIYYSHMYLLRAKHALCRADFAHVNTRSAQIVGPILQRFFKKEDVKKYKKKILKLQRKFPYEEYKMVSTNADYKSSREVCLKKEFERAIEISFEGIPSYAYSHYDKHLKKYYGDYLKLPPKDKQKEKHGFDAWIDEDFRL